MTQDMLQTAAEWVARAIEVIGIGVILVGAIAAMIRYGSELVRPSDDRGIADLRSGLGRSILLGLEFLVAADIINTVAIEPTLESLAVLAGIVLIRTFLSFSLEVEIEGKWPWQRAQARQPGHPGTIGD